MLRKNAEPSHPLNGEECTFKSYEFTIHRPGDAFFISTSLHALRATVPVGRPARWDHVCESLGIGYSDLQMRRLPLLQLLIGWLWVGQNAGLVA